MSAGPTLPDPAAVERRHVELTEQAAASGYQLTPDAQFAHDLVRGLLVNQARYGYEACPCRFATGTRADDRDIICPCDYRDDDLAEHGSCY